ncbi:uncharacterized protein PAC_17780 [Phialocephala subalpina]|uniref:Bulb-type lectin domain-containing protein n=1 Tax=Phialocephala subalpina TaxID=576137 RepID=A0A1L7XS53_9HELO|nr:uncharacterized protein PAC_17780 [Phialocephala subalpina]
MDPVRLPRKLVVPAGIIVFWFLVAVIFYNTLGDSFHLNPWMGYYSYEDWNGGPNSTGSYQSRKINILKSDVSGLLLSSSKRTLKAPGGAYQLELQEDGDLVVSTKDQRGAWTRHIKWSAGTGATCCGMQKGIHTLLFENDGRLVVLAKNENKPALVVWHSNLLLECQNAMLKIGETGSADKASTSVLSLDDQGTLEIVRDGSPMCAIYKEEKDVADGRLAVVISGLYRSNAIVCSSHIDLIKSWNGTGVDVFFYTFFDDRAVKADVQEKAIRECYGEYLKDLAIVEEEYETMAPELIPPQCDGNSPRIHAQLKTAMLSGAMMDRYTIKTGVTYDRVLRMRPDNMFWGVMPELKTELGTLLRPHPYGEHYFYCSRASDQIAFGTLQDMRIWFNMYNYHNEILEYARDGKAFTPFGGCEDIPAGPGREGCTRSASCAVECLMGYYLELMGVKFQVAWNWQENVQRMGTPKLTGPGYGPLPPGYS